MLPSPDFRAKVHLISTKLVLGGFSRDGVVGIGGGGGGGCDGGGDDGGGDGGSVDVVMLEVSIW